MTSVIAWIICAVAIMGVALLTLIMIMRRRKQKIRDLTMRQKLVEQKMANVRNRHNHDKIAFGIDNNPQPESGCTSWIYLPDNYKYEI